MHRYFFEKRLFLLILLVGLALLAVRITAGQENPSAVGTGLLDVNGKLQEPLMQVGRSFKKWISFPVSLVHAVRRNRELEERVAELEGELRRAEELRLENERLKHLLKFMEDNSDSYQTLAARVVARDPGNWFGTVVINRGERDGVREKMPVVAPEGLVGRVLTVSSTTSEVLLITDPRSSVGSMLQSIREPGIVEGVVSGSSTLRMVTISKNADVRPGQVVITSGVGSIFPKGIPIGTVVKVKHESSGLFKEASVRPYVDLDRLEEVLVITAVSEGMSRN